MPPLDASTLALIGNAAALIWGASKQAATLDQLTKAVNKLEVTTTNLGTEVADHETRLSVIEHTGRR